MTTPFFCLLLAVLIPYVLSAVGGYYRTRQFGALDNESPRQQQASLEGVGARVQAAQDNAREALPVFLAAVLVAHLAGVDAGTTATLSVAFIFFRVLHAVCYVANWATLRSVAFLAGFACCLVLFGQAARV